MVHTDAATHTKSEPVPHGDALRAMVRENKPLFESLGRPTFDPPPPGAYSFQMSVRKTDCDSFGHVNNAGPSFSLLYP